MFTNPERNSRVALRVHTLLCNECRSGLGRPAGLLSHHRVKLASDYAAEEAQRLALGALRDEQREREKTRKAVLLMAAHGYVRRGEE